MFLSKICPKCGYENKDSAKGCSKCGASFKDFNIEKTGFLANKKLIRMIAAVVIVILVLAIAVQIMDDGKSTEKVSTSNDNSKISSSNGNSKVSQADSTQQEDYNDKILSIENNTTVSNPDVLDMSVKEYIADSSAVSYEDKQEINMILDNRYYASQNGKFFHRIDCDAAGNISMKNLISFKNKDAAYSLGKKPCTFCNP